MRISWIALGSLMAAFAFTPSVRGQATTDSASTTSTSATASTQQGATTQQDGFFHDSFTLLSETQSEQPHWMTPLATTTPRLEQEFRYDMKTQPHNSGLVTGNFGVSKGFEIIPPKRWEVILGVPPYIENNPDSAKDGFGDSQFLVKYRFAAGNTEHGNFILHDLSRATWAYASASSRRILGKGGPS